MKGFARSSVQWTVVEQIQGWGCQFLFQYLVFDSLDVRPFDKQFGVKLHAETLIDLRSQFDGGDRTQSHVTEVGHDSEIAVRDDTCDHVP